MSLLILLSLAMGGTSGVLMVRRQVGGWWIAALVIGLVLGSFVLFGSAFDPSITDQRGNPVLDATAWTGLCGLLFSLALGLGALLAGIVGQFPKSKPKRRRS